jgi:hypothetical protein
VSARPQTVGAVPLFCLLYIFSAGWLYSADASPPWPRAEFVQGQLVDALCGFTNTGDKGFNVTGLRGSLHSPLDPSFHIQNFTEMSPYTEIKMGEEGTLQYRFFPDPALEPRDYILVLSVDYVDADQEQYRTVYFNSTIEMVESDSSATSRTFFGRVLGLGLLAALGFAGLQLYKKYVVGKRRSRPAETAAKPSADEYLKDVNMPGARPNSKKQK